jgi:hypothetical protein
MRDVWRWWKGRKQELKALLVLALILLWMSLSLWQSQRHLHKVMRANEQILKELDTTRRLQLGQLTEVLEAHQAQQDLDAAALRVDLWDLKHQLGQLVQQPPPRSGAINVW